MKMKKKLIICTLGLFLIFAVVSLIIKVQAATVKEADDHVYYTNFEGMVVNENSTVDQNTGFIWSNNWSKTKTVNRNNSTMLEMPLYDSTTYSTVGGFGIADNANLGKCIYGEAYDVETYFEIVNTEYVFVEFVGGDGKWGSVIVYPNGKIIENSGGTNMSNVSYVDNVLKFTFTMSFNSAESVNGYIKFTAYNCNNGYIYLDNVSIDYAENVLDDDFENKPIGTFNTHTATVLNNFYTENGAVSEYIKDGDSTVAKFSFKPSQNYEGLSMFFINKLGFLNHNRQYDFSFDMKTENVSELWVYHSGTWISSPSYFYINMSTNSIEIFGSVFEQVAYENGKLNIKFNTNVSYSEWNQFQFIVKAAKAKVQTVVTVDNLKITQTPVVNELNLDTDRVKKNYICGDELDLTNLAITAIYTNGFSKEIEINDCEISGFDSQQIGPQFVEIKYQGATAKFKVEVNRKIDNLVINTDGIKTTYAYGEEIDLTNLKVEIKFTDDVTEELNHGAIFGGYSIDLGGYDSHTPDTYTVTIYYLNYSQTFTVVVNSNSSVSFDSFNYQGTGK